MSKTLCKVYRSAQKEGMYLYVAHRDDLARVPAALLQRFGRAELVMTLVITPDKQLAKLDGAKLLAELEAKGYYLQLPPPDDPDMRAVHEKNDKFYR